MELKSLVKYLNKVLELDPPVPMDNEKGTLEELAALKDDLTPEDYNLLNRDACRELLKRNLVPEKAMEVVCKKAGKAYTPKEKPVSEKKSVKKPVKKNTEASADAPAKPVKKESSKEKPESNEELAKRLKDEGKKIQTLTNELRKRYEAKGKAFTDEWLEKRAAIYWRIAK